ncbi:MAG: hypothetical protein ABSA09_03970 [Desulfobaccales bacterium]|jgi:hypothetical protein
MKLEFLGDALDHWKGSVFEGLQSSNVLNGFRVDAMISDIGNWAPEHLSLYAKLLRVKSHKIVEHKGTLDRNRKEYFDEIPRSGDLFLDPDTGIMPCSGGDIRHLKHEELFSLMNYEGKRVVAVYQHGSHTMSLKSRVEDVLNMLRSVHPNCYCASYYSSSCNVTLLFFSFQRNHIESVNRYFHKLLGSHGDKRIGLWI